jgi:hypothetical protein
MSEAVVQFFAPDSGGRQYIRIAPPPFLRTPDFPAYPAAKFETAQPCLQSCARRGRNTAFASTGEAIVAKAGAAVNEKVEPFPVLVIPAGEKPQPEW